MLTEAWTLCKISPDCKNFATNDSWPVHKQRVMSICGSVSLHQLPRMLPKIVQAFLLWYSFWVTGCRCMLGAFDWVQRTWCNNQSALHLATVKVKISFIANSGCLGMHSNQAIKMIITNKLNEIVVEPGLRWIGLTHQLHCASKIQPEHALLDWIDKVLQSLAECIGTNHRLSCRSPQ